MLKIFYVKMYKTICEIPLLPCKKSDAKEYFEREPQTVEDKRLKKHQSIP